MEVGLVEVHANCTRLPSSLSVEQHFFSNKLPSHGGSSGNNSVLKDPLTSLLFLYTISKNYVSFPLKIQFSLWNIIQRITCTAMFCQGTYICHSLFFMILLPLEFMLFINTSHITYTCERSIVHSPLIAYYRRNGNR